MNNEMIILLEGQKLAEDGIIAYTGREISVVDSTGKKVIYKETEEIHTFDRWKKMGFFVKKGEKAIAKFLIWKHIAKKDENDEETNKMFLKKASFFSRSQVEKANFFAETTHNNEIATA